MGWICLHDKIDQKIIMAWGRKKLRFFATVVNIIPWTRDFGKGIKQESLVLPGRILRGTVFMDNPLDNEL